MIWSLTLFIISRSLIVLPMLRQLITPCLNVSKTRENRRNKSSMSWRWGQNPRGWGYPWRTKNLLRRKVQVSIPNSFSHAKVFQSLSPRKIRKKIIVEKAIPLPYLFTIDRVFFASDMRSMLNHSSAAAYPKLVTYFNLGVSKNHGSLFSGIGKRVWRYRVVSYQCFILTEENCLSSTMAKCW